MYSVEWLVGGGDIAFQILFPLSVLGLGFEFAAGVGVVLVLTYPLRPHHAPAPGLVAGFHLSENAWMLSGEVGTLLGILL